MTTPTFPAAARKPARGRARGGPRPSPFPDELSRGTIVSRVARAISAVAITFALATLTLGGARAQQPGEPTATGSARIRRGARETRFHLLVHGHSVSLSVETGRCRRGSDCEMSWHFLFEGLLDTATPEIVASLTRAQSRMSRPPEPVPMEPANVRLVCRTPLALGTTRIVGRCRLMGPLPREWRDLPRAFELARAP